MNVLQGFVMLSDSEASGQEWAGCLASW